MTKTHRLSFAAWATLIFGALMIIASIAISYFMRDVFDVKASILVFSLLFAGLLFSFTGVHGVYREKLTDRWLKGIDLLWISLSSLTVLIALIEPLFHDVEKQWNDIDAENETQRQIIVEGLSAALRVNCPAFDWRTSRPDDVCFIIFRERNGLDYPRAQPRRALEIADNPALSIPNQKNVRHAIEYVMSNKKFYDATWYSFLAENKTLTGYAMRITLLIAVALRFSKSATEVFWRVPTTANCTNCSRGDAKNLGRSTSPAQSINWNAPNGPAPLPPKIRSTFVAECFSGFTPEDFRPFDGWREYFSLSAFWILPSTLYVLAIDWLSQFKTTEYLHKAVSEAISPTLWNVVGVFAFLTLGCSIIGMRFQSLHSRLIKCAHKLLTTTFEIGLLMFGLLLGQLIDLIKNTDDSHVYLHASAVFFLLVIALLYNTAVWYVSAITYQQGSAPSFMNKIAAKSIWVKTALALLFGAFPFILLMCEK